jgi:hypothetical protein
MAALELIWLFLPEGAEVLIVVGIAMAMMLGVLPRTKAFAWLGCFLLSLVLLPFLPALLGALPWWLSVLVLAWMWSSLVGLVGRMLVGRRAWDGFKAKAALKLVTGTLRGAWWLVRLPFRGAWRLGRWLFRHPPPPVECDRTGHGHPATR